MADSITRLAVFLTFTQPPVHLPVPLIFIFLYRDSVISTLRTLCALRGVALAARTSGKIKAAVQASAAFLIVLLMIAQLYDKITTSQLQELSFMIAAIAAIYTLLSGIEYIYANRHYIGSALSTSQEAQP
jgi:phosphatidylglycerophosphate synthase